MTWRGWGILRDRLLRGFPIPNFLHVRERLARVDERKLASDCAAGARGWEGRNGCVVVVVRGGDEDDG
jgi:hypothetical protein